MGYERTWQQCQVKVKDIIFKCSKTRDSNRRSRKGQQEFRFYQEVDAVLGIRSTSEAGVFAFQLQ